MYDIFADYEEFVRPLDGKDDERTYQHSIKFRKSGENVNIVHVWHGWDRDKATVIGQLPERTRQAASEAKCDLLKTWIDLLEVRVTTSEQKARGRFTIRVFTNG